MQNYFFLEAPKPDGADGGPPASIPPEPPMRPATGQASRPIASSVSVSEASSTGGGRESGCPPASLQGRGEPSASKPQGLPTVQMPTPPSSPLPTRPDATGTIPKTPKSDPVENITKNLAAGMQLAKPLGKLEWNR